MQRQQLSANLREKTGKGVARKLRAQGALPAILYGMGEQPLPLSVNARDFTKAVSSASGINVIVDLKIQGKDQVSVMVKDYQAHCIDRNFLHVDFLKVDLTKKVQVEVPIVLVGKSIGVKDGGILEHITRTLSINCLPTAIPNSLEVDVSALKIGDNLHVHDVKFPEGIELAGSADQTIAAVVAPAEEVVAAPSAEVVQPEVLTEKKPAEGAAPAGDKKDEKKDKKK